MTQRDNFIDELRGIALLGIAIANLPAFAYLEPYYPQFAVETQLDQLAGFLNYALIKGKFIALFCFLFGYSLAYLKKELQVRRLIVIGVLGCLHGIFLFFGDILFTYATLGAIVMLQIHKSTTGSPKIVGWGMYVCVFLVLSLAVGMMFLPPEAFESTSKAIRQIYGPDYWLSITPRFIEWISTHLLAIILFGPLLLALMRFGFVAHQNDWLSSDRFDSKFWSGFGRLIWIAPLLISLILAYLLIQDGPKLLRTWQGFLLDSVQFMTAPLLTITYIAWLGKLRQHRPESLRRFRAVGRMALTAYLMQSLIMVVLYSGWGFALNQQLGAAANFAISLAIFGSIAVIAHFWLARFERGPAETLVAWLIRPKGA